MSGGVGARTVGRPIPRAKDGHEMATQQQVPPRERLLAGVPVSERRLELAGVSTAVLEGGTGRTVVLLHGPGANAAHWMRVIPQLVGTHRVIAPDLPGQGASELTGCGELDGDRVMAW